jgi:uncharacterized protein with HEPN domain
MNEHDQRTYLEHIRAALERIADYTTQGKDAFLTSTLLQDAVLRNLEVVGEAVKRLAPEVRALAPDTPWRRIAGLRDVLIHHYFGVDLEAVWLVVEKEVPVLHGVVAELLQRRQD